MARPGCTKMDLTYIIGELPQYHWSLSKNQLRTYWRGIRISYSGGYYYLTQKGDVNAYKYYSLGEVIEQLHKMSASDQMSMQL